MGCHPSHWRTHIFQRVVGQPPVIMSWMSRSILDPLRNTSTEASPCEAAVRIAEKRQGRSSSGRLDRFSWKGEVSKETTTDWGWRWRIMTDLMGYFIEGWIQNAMGYGDWDEIYFRQNKGFKRIWWDIAGFELFLGYNAGLTIFAWKGGYNFTCGEWAPMAIEKRLGKVWRNDPELFASN